MHLGNIVRPMVSVAHCKDFTQYLLFILIPIIFTLNMLEIKPIHLPTEHPISPRYIPIEHNDASNYCNTRHLESLKSFRGTSIFQI